MKPITLKEIKKHHNNNPKDKTLHTEIENKELDNKIFNKLIQESTKHEPFDKKENTPNRDKTP